MFLMLIFGGVLAWQHITKIETPDGYIVIESNVEDLEVFVDEQRIAYITDPRDNKKNQSADPQRRQDAPREQRRILKRTCRSSICKE